MEESFYHNIADIALNKLLEYAERLEDNFDIEVELESGVLTITLPNKKQYVINKHTPSRQIWVSSPVSGAGYFELVNNQWQPKRLTDGEEKELFEFIKSELDRIL